MHFTENAKLEFLSLHYVGNRMNNEALLLTEETVTLDDNLSVLLSNFFSQPFKEQEYFQFTHPSDVKLNEVYTYVSEIFKDFNTFHDNSKKLAKHLFRACDHANIKGGEFYVAYFKNVLFDGERLNCIGIFKTENKDVFLKIYPNERQFDIEAHEGININKLDKGCLIFNTEKQDGYAVTVVDKTNSKSEMAQYWVDDFLQVDQREDSYFNTKSTLDFYHSFVLERLPDEYDIDKIDQAELLNRTMSYFKNNESFNQKQFTAEVLADDELIQSFNQYKTVFQSEQNIVIEEEFQIHESAVKKKARVYKSVIKLDKNFHIYVHGDRNKIERGQDQNGKYYKVYYTQET